MTKFFEKKELATSITTPFPPNIMTTLKTMEENATLLIADATWVTVFLWRQFLVEFEPE